MTVYMELGGKLFECELNGNSSVRISTREQENGGEGC